MIRLSQFVVKPASASAIGSFKSHDLYYLSSTASCQQPLCCDVEGWGPLNPSRNDFTSCFLNLSIFLVSVLGLVAGAPIIRRLARGRGEEEARKDWRTRTKLANDLSMWAEMALVVSLLVVGVIQYLEKQRSRSVTAFLASYWVLLLLVLGANLHSSVSRRHYRKDLTSFIFSCVNSVLVCIEQPLEQGENECPSERATLFSTLTFSWMTPMMRHGYKQYITEDDLWDLPQRDTARAATDSFEEAWAHEQACKKKKKPSLWIALFRGFGAAYAQGALFKAVADVLAILQPQLLRGFISFVDSYGGAQPQPFSLGVATTLSMFAVSVAQSLCLHQCFQRLSQTGIKLKSSLVSKIYKKSLRLSNEARGTKSTGDIINLMAVDTQRLQDVTQFSQHLWSAPLQIILCMASLYGLLGYSMFAGVALMIATIPINGSITKSMRTLQKRQMNNKDARSRVIAEVIANMKSIKLFGWGSAFAKRISHIRNDRELVTLRKTGALQTFSSFIGSTTPFMVAYSSFAVRVLVQRKPLTTEIVFPAIVLFQLLTSPLTILPAAISSVTEASVAVSRLVAFFTADELQPDAVIHEEAVIMPGEESVSVSDATFRWTLEEINFSAHNGELCCLIGRVGAGKSSILQALLGDLYKANGTVILRGSVAYVAQQPWVFNATIRDNITFGKPWDPDFYLNTLEACALMDDLAQLPSGDRTGVGDKGITLSGGQKVRLTLARAVYARADIYLLDDCLSAVDQHVGRHLIENVFGRRGLLKDRTRILATNSTPVLSEADAIVLIRDGKILEQGTYDELNNKGGDFVSFTVRESTTPRFAAAEEGSPNGQKQVGQTKVSKTLPSEHRAAAKGHAAVASNISPERKIVDLEAAASKPNKRKELTYQGSAKWKVYGEYAEASSLVAVALYALTLVGAQAAEIGGNVWLKQWTEANDDSNTDSDVIRFLGIYATFGLGSAGLVILQSSTLWLWCSIKASRKLHENMVIAILRSPMAFFETTPAGQILNRFCSDMYRIDESLPRQFNSLFISIVKGMFSLAVISFGTPAFIVLAIPLIMVYGYLQQYYLRAKRELKRLDGVSRSPVFAHFQESLGGLTTIRAYAQQKRFSLEIESRSDANMRAYIPSITANRWLGVRLEFIGSIIILSAAGLMLASLSLGRYISAGMAGLIITYALQITQSFSSLVRATGEVATNIVSAERILEYTHLPSEAPDIIPNHRPAISWPSEGSVAFVNYSTRYRPELSLVLRNLNLNFQAGEKLGVVGRTGAGKSSLALALFRIIEPSAGSIRIDEIDTSSIGLLDVRKSLTVIPQDPALFEGTVRENLDPGEEHDDTELWTALGLARLKEHVASMTGGLDANIYEGGSNLSQGQKQLVSLARAMLKPASILVLDEATAAVDAETDALIQETLRENIFSNRTVITIAHRINTVIDSDRIVVLEKGEVVEFDTPEALMQQKGAFYQLVKEAGLLERLR
ncbi:multidrug resistance-associated protein 1 [Mariannaea sp. PMI_226]|nr:multidrug resistance-associated protein 1 [Mariannaea sp. PMI_226]